jgi:hypothetical protein
LHSRTIKYYGYSVFIIQSEKIVGVCEERLLLSTCKPEQKNGYERKQAKEASMRERRGRYKRR